LIDRDANINAQCNAGWTPLHKACLKGYVEIVQLLCENGAKVDIQSNDEHDTPLHDACSNGHKDVVLVLLQHGANPRIHNSEGRFPREMIDDNLEELKDILLEATKSFKETKESNDTREDSEPPISLLTKRHSRRTSTASDAPIQLPATGRPKRGVTTEKDDFLARDINYRDSNGRRHLHLQALQGHSKFVRELLRIGAAHHARDREGNQPLHLAARGGHYEVALALLEYGADANAISKQGATPLHEVAGRGHKDIIEMLLFYGANPTIQDDGGRTALDVAIESPSTASEGEVDVLKKKFVEFSGVRPTQEETSVKMEETDEATPIEDHVDDPVVKGRFTSALASPDSGRRISSVTAAEGEMVGEDPELEKMDIDPPEPHGSTSPMQITDVQSPAQMETTGKILHEPSEPPPEPRWKKLAALNHLSEPLIKELDQLLPIFTMQFHNCTSTQIYVAHTQICSLLGFTSQELFENCTPIFCHVPDNRSPIIKTDTFKSGEDTILYTICLACFTSAHSFTTFGM
jgi:ankyrin repeat protein